MQKRITLILAVIAGFIGGLLPGSLKLRTVQASDGYTSQVLSAHEFRLVDKNGAIGAQLAYSGEGTPVLFLFDKNGKPRAEIGTYGDGLPCVVLMDEQSRAVGLFRLAGANQSPVLVMKSDGRDRMIMGLNMNGPGHEPFLVTYDESGQKKEIFGKY